MDKHDNEFNPKLSSCSNILIDHLNWEIRDQYLELLDNYQKKTIDTFSFRMRFFERYDSIEKVAHLLESNRVLLSPDKNSLDFGDLLQKIYDYCQAYSDDPEPFRHRSEITDVQFQILLEKTYLEIQNVLK